MADNTILIKNALILNPEKTYDNPQDILIRNDLICEISDEINEKADSALLAFLNIIKKLNKSKEILIYRKDPLLIEKFGKNKILWGDKYKQKVILLKGLIFLWIILL